MKKYALLACASILFLAVHPAHGQLEPDVGIGVESPSFERIGQAGFQFLKLPTSARQAGIGGILSSAGYADAATVFTNPASTVNVENFNVAISHVQWFADIDYQSAAALKNFGGIGTIGVHVFYLDYGDMPRTENRPILDQGVPTGRSEVLTDLGTVSAHNLAVGVTYARRITDRLDFGVNAKYISETLDDANVGAWAVDVGTVFYTGLRSLRVTMVGKNIGPDTQIAEFDERVGYEPSNVRMPVNFNFGVAYDVIEAKEASPHAWTFAAEFVHPNDGPEKLNTGTEYVFRDLLALRAGYRFNYDEEGLTLGGGLKVTTSTGVIGVNYAWWDFGVLGYTHMFSLAFGR
jgi:hypothetical protein